MTKTKEQDKQQVFDPSRNPRDFGGTPRGGKPGHQAGDPTPTGDVSGRRSY